MFPFRTGPEIRRAFLDFYRERGHVELPSASLIPADPTVLLTIAGMLPFKPVFLGQEAPPAPRATTSQKCVRTNDIENVGRTARHHTFFEMLGNFSFGDYFKKEAITWAWELLTTVYHLPPGRLWVSVFTEDDEALGIWRDVVGIPEHRIQRMGADSNFWVSGPTGPCGPCSEIYYDFHPELGEQGIDLDDDTRFLEIYNLVFMQYNRDSVGVLTPLAQQNIDTGLGLERLAQVLQQVPNNYETDLVYPLIETTATLANLIYPAATDEEKRSLKIIADHLRAVSHLIADGVTPANLGRGYVLRRLIRRAIRHGRLLGIKEPFTPVVAQTVIQLYNKTYPQLTTKQAWIEQVLRVEEQQFRRTLETGERLLERILAKHPPMITGAEAFMLYDTYGFPLELTEEVANEQGVAVDQAGYHQEMERQQVRAKSAHQTLDLTQQGGQELSEIAQTEFLGYLHTQGSGTVVALFVAQQLVEQVAAGDEVKVVLNSSPFYAESGGQVGDRGYLATATARVRVLDVQKQGDIYLHHGEVETGTLQVGDTVQAQVDEDLRRRARAHHTATHLLQSALKQLVDPNITQAGSLVAFDRLRFDFNCPRSLTEDEVEQVETLVNRWVSEAHPLTIEVLPIAEAKARGAVAMFGEKYGAEVRVIDVANVSMELCGGIHVHNTSEIGLFKILGETGVAAGVRRIEAVAGPSTADYLKVRDKITRQLSNEFKVTVEEVPARIVGLQQELRRTQRELEQTQTELATLRVLALANQAVALGEFKTVVAEVPPAQPDALKSAAERLAQKIGGAVVLATRDAGKVTLVVAFSPAIVQRGLNAGKFIAQVAGKFGARGGGRPNLAQA
ncbi:alanine--tRNA ligase, partial [Candidatus Cyanaurora vandensis]